MMAGQTKMIIITSDEDLIRQFALKNNSNTQIIELDDNEQIISTDKEKTNMMNLAFLAELSELNSKNDQVYKRALDSPHHNRSKHSKLSKKSLDLICTICGDRAIGFNYDVLSCPSCKAFFRRNAIHQHSSKLTCLTGRNQCCVVHEMRRKCSRCRLNRCFMVGMRKDFILSEEEKQQRKKRLEENRSISSKRSSLSESTYSSQLLPTPESLPDMFDDIDRLLTDLDKDNDHKFLDVNIVSTNTQDLILGTLSIEEWITIESIRSSFVLAFEDQKSCGYGIDVADRASALLSWSQSASQTALRFIGLFRQIDEFENLHDDDRLLLIKFNLMAIFPIFKCFIYKPLNAQSSHEDKEDDEKHRQFFILFDTSKDIIDIFVNLILSLVQVTEQDPTLLSLLMVILLFTQGLSMNENQPPLKDELAVHRAQNHYTKILWNYLVHQRGEMQAYKYMIQLLTIIFRIQTVSKGFRDFFRTQFLISNTVDRMAPLMQTVLNIS